MRRGLKFAGDNMFVPTRKVRKGDAALIASAGPFKVTSQANGQFQITAAWAPAVPKDCKVSPENWCPAHDCYHIGGVFTRIAIAEAIQALLSAPAARSAPPENLRRERETE